MVNSRDKQIGNDMKTIQQYNESEDLVLRVWFSGKRADLFSPMKPALLVFSVPVLQATLTEQFGVLIITLVQIQKKSYTIRRKFVE